MARDRRKSKRRSLLSRVPRRRPLRSITLLPSLVTLVNGMCGFAALVFAGSGGVLPDRDPAAAVALACYLVFVAMLADMVDGSLARFSQSTSSFGGQLDSLCDAISFGAAPAYLMIAVLRPTLAASGFSHDHPVSRFVWLAALVYLACAVIRLARFNVENSGADPHRSFIGLPSPAAAGVVVSLILLKVTKLPEWDWILYGLPLVTLAVAVLMVSRVRYPHLVNAYLRGRKPFYYLLLGTISLLAALLYLQAALVVCFGLFAFGSVSRGLWRRWGRHPGTVLTAELAADSSTVDAGSAEH